MSSKAISKTKRGHPSSLWRVAETPPLDPEPSDNIDDPARLVLIGAEEAKRKRLRDEASDKLKNIMGRVDGIVDEYESAVDTESFMGALGNSDKLHDLTDTQVRSKYYQDLSMFIKGYEQKREEMENALSQLQDFFVEMQAGGTQQLLEQVTGEEINVDKGTALLEGALKTAKTSISKLLGIKKEMDRLMGIMAAYSNTSKGRKKMEKALIKAQDEVVSFSRNLDEMQTNMQKNADQYKQLQVQLDVKTQECTKLHDATDQLKQLQISNISLSNELESTQKALKESLDEKDAKNFVISPATASLGTDMEKLEAELEHEKNKYQDLESQMGSLIKSHESKIEIVKAEHEAKSEEMRGRFEKQLKSLTEEDDIFREVAKRDDENSLHHTAFHMESSQPSQTSLLQDDLTNDSPLKTDEISPVTSQTSIPTDKQDISDHEMASDHKMAFGHDKQMEDLKQQYAVREKLIRKQAEESKNKSFKMVMSLQKQLSEATSTNTVGDETEKLKAELEDMRKQLFQAQSQRSELEHALATMETEKTALLGELLQSEADIEKVKEELVSQQSSIVSQRSSIVTQLPLQEESPMQSESIVPLVATEIALDDIPDVFPLSLEQSVVSMYPAPLGSPLNSSFNDGESFMPGSHQPVPYNLSMLAGSRMSHYSSAPQTGAVNHGHPVVTEWVKAYDSVIKFKDNVISVLKEHRDTIPQLSGLIEELQSMDVHTMDKKHDAQGQITEMRFNLALLLHQIEQTLQESFCQMMSWYPASSSSPGGKQPVKNEPLVDELKTTVHDLEQMLATSKNRHASEVEAYKDTIAKHSTTIESLHIKLTKLRNSLSALAGNGTIMFSHVEAERNSRKLWTAVDKNMLSSEDLESLTKDMEEYLTIPMERLAVMAHRLLEKSAMTKLVRNICKICVDPKQAADVLENIVTMDDKRQEKYSNYMIRSGVKRSNLASSLTHDLREAEKQVGTVLMKPIFGATVPRSHDIITPISRPLPVNQHYFALRKRYISAGTGSRRSRPITGFDQASTMHSHMTRAQTSSPLMQRQQEQHRLRASTAKPSRRNYTPPDPSSRQMHYSPLLATHRTPGSTEPQWNTTSTHQESYVDSSVPGYPFPKIQELDLPRNSLIGATHNTLPQSHAPPPVLIVTPPPLIPPSTLHHLNPSHKKLISLPEESSPTNLKIHDKPWIRTLPSVHLPMQTDSITATDM